VDTLSVTTCVDLKRRRPVWHARTVCPAVVLATLLGVVAVVQASENVVVLTTDYSTGSLASLPVASPWPPQTNLAPICPDAVARIHDGLIYVINRMGCDNVEIIDPAHGWSVVREFSVGSGTNPQDIALVSRDRAYVSRYESNDLLEINPETGGQLGTISLAGLADSDGLCEMHRMIISGNFLYVELQRMIRNAWPDPWVPAPPSYLAVINLMTRTLVDVDLGAPGMQGIALIGTNPIAPMQIDVASGDLLVPTAGVYGANDAAGIERINLQRWQTTGFVITEEALGGDLIDFAQWSDAQCFALISEPGFNTTLISFDPRSGGRSGTLYAPGGYVLADCLTRDAYLYVSDRDYFHPGIRVYNAVTGSLVSGGAIPTGLPPNELLLLPDWTADAAALIQGGCLGFPFPNPSSGSVRLRWNSIAGVEPAPVEVYDAPGRLIRRLAAGEAGGLMLEWDGRDGDGRAVASGTYYLRIARRGGSFESRAVRLVR
jgi:hypothetical protein